MSRAGEDGDVAGASKKPRVAENDRNENEHVDWWFASVVCSFEPMGIGSTQQERSRSDNRQCRHQCTSIEPTVILPRQHQTFEVTNEHEHARAFLDPIAFRVNVLPGLGGVILVIFRRGLALKEERES
jgi:hypothetical protein